MARYIDADKLLKEFEVDTSKDVMDISDIVFGAVTSIIEKQPTADVVEVKHGEWFTLDNCANEGVYCSVCHKKVYKKCYANQKLKSKHCPNCGAKMDGGKAE